MSLRTACHSDTGEVVVSEHVVAMFPAILPTGHGLACGIFVAHVGRHILRPGAIRKFLLDLSQPCGEAAMADGAAIPDHVDAVLFRLHADDRIERERFKTLRATQIVHLLMYAHDEFRIARRMGLDGRRCFAEIFCCRLRGQVLRAADCLGAVANDESKTEAKRQTNTNKLRQNVEALEKSREVFIDRSS